MDGRNPACHVTTQRLNDDLLSVCTVEATLLEIRFHSLEQQGTPVYGLQIMLSKKDLHGLP